jgi:hypothetical protein
VEILEVPGRGEVVLIAEGVQLRGQVCHGLASSSWSLTCGRASGSPLLSYACSPSPAPSEMGSG